MAEMRYSYFLQIVTFTSPSRDFHCRKRDASNSAFCLDKYKSQTKSLSSACVNKCFLPITISLPLFIILALELSTVHALIPGKTGNQSSLRCGIGFNIDETSVYFKLL